MRLRTYRGSVLLRVGAWPSGLYYAKLCAYSARCGYAPFVVRPRRLGQHRVAVVLPTNTWAAYNFEDDNGDGLNQDSWYADPSVASVDLDRPFLDHGVPPNFYGYDRGFIRWLAQRYRDLGGNLAFLSANNLFYRVERRGDRLFRMAH